jgi:hypothetical protein
MADQNLILTLTPAEAVALQRSLDLWPLNDTRPPGFWELQSKLVAAVGANPQAKKEIDVLLESQ